MYSSQLRLEVVSNLRRQILGSSSSCKCRGEPGALELDQDKICDLFLLKETGNSICKVLIESISNYKLENQELMKDPHIGSRQCCVISIDGKLRKNVIDRSLMYKPYNVEPRTEP